MGESSVVFVYRAMCRISASTYSFATRIYTTYGSSQLKLLRGINIDFNHPVSIIIYYTRPKYRHMLEIPPLQWIISGEKRGIYTQLSRTSRTSGSIRYEMVL